MVRLKLFGAAFVAVAGVGIAWEVWPSETDDVGYPFAPGELGEGHPLWELTAEELTAAAERDRRQVERAESQLARTLAEVERSPLLRREDVESFDAEERGQVRRFWWALLEPLLELDGIKHRWEHWYGVDYLRHPEEHARAYAITYAALAVQVDAGQTLLSHVEGNDRIQRLFDEAMPELGLSAGTFSQVRRRISRMRDQSFILVGGEWYDAWIAEHLRESEMHALVSRLRPEAEAHVDVDALRRTLVNKTELLEREAFERWFPLQREVATWFGDTRLALPNRRLISDAQLEAMADALRPGDIIVERRNWYLSNVGLPGFWPHAALFVGTPADLRAAFDDDPEVRAAFGGSFTEHLAQRHPDAWTALGESDHGGHPHRVLEAVSEGVVTASLEHSCAADYVGALRPRLAPIDVARAIDRAFGYFGRPYDFDFDFATDDTVVCSELVMKAYEPIDDGPGLRVPSIEVAGRIAIPPTEIVRTFAAERGRDDAQLGFVYFLDGVEATHEALVRDGSALAASIDRPKWDVLQR